MYEPCSCQWIWWIEVFIIKEAGWSTNYSSDLPNHFTYNILGHKLLKNSKCFSLRIWKLIWLKSDPRSSPFFIWRNPAWGHLLVNYWFKNIHDYFIKSEQVLENIFLGYKQKWNLMTKHCHMFSNLWVSASYHSKSWYKLFSRNPKIVLT